MKAENLIIIAGGDASRLQKFHQNLIPKILLNVGENTVLFHQLSFWKDRVKTISIVVKNRDEIYQIRQYVKLIFPELENSIQYFDIDSAFHTMYKLNHVSMFARGSVYITWSDIYPVLIEEHDMDRNYIIGDKKCTHRFHFDENQHKIIEQPNGNLCGMFYLNDVDTISHMYDWYANKYYKNNINNLDFTKVIQELLADEEFEGQFDLVDAEIIDTGDVNKFVDANQSSENKYNSTRYFNQINFKIDTVEKISRNSKGEELLCHENRYYDFIKKHPHVAQIFPEKKYFNNDYDGAFLTLEKIKGKTVFNFINENDPDYENLMLAESIMNEFSKKIDILHSLNYEHQLTSDHFYLAKRKEYSGVTFDRLKSIEHYIEYIQKINDVDVPEFRQIIKRIDDYLSIKAMNDESFNDLGFIHGDPNLSNVMVEDPLEEIKFIDPRGTFGNLTWFGDKKYDYAKFIYGLSGYDEFNTSNPIDLMITTTKNEDGSIYINYKMPKAYELDDLTDDIDLKIIVSIIWMKLSAYIINNPIKAIMAYSHGALMFMKYYKAFKNEHQLFQNQQQS